MQRFVQMVMAVGLVGMALSAPAAAAPIMAAPAGGQVGNGTPLSCDESHFDMAVAGGGLVTFDCGAPVTITLTSATAITQDTTIDGGNSITLTGNLATQLFTVGVAGKLALKDIVLDRGYANHNSGGTIVNAGSLSLDHVVIQNSVADQLGGAIWTSGPVAIRNSSLHNNSGKSGGAITTQNAIAVTIDDSSFTFNTSLDGVNGVGGAIQMGAGGQLTVTGGSLNSNLAPLEGGAIDLAAGASATIVPSSLGGTQISFNAAQAFGGAISNNAGRLVMIGADIEYNHTPTNTTAYGGAIDNEGTLVVEDSQFRNNQGHFGGALFSGSYLFPVTAAITHTVFFANVAGAYGGAIYMNTVTTTVSIADSSFEFNQAGAGGGLARTDAHLNISKSSFTSNAAGFGGAMFLQALPLPTDGPYVEVRDSTLSGNLATAQHSGGIDNAGLVDLHNVTVKNNHYGLWNENGGHGAIIRVQSSVLDNPGGLNCDSDSDGVLPTSGGHNYATDTSCALAGFMDTQGSNLDAMLGPLTFDPGHLTYFHMPLAGSPLINQGGPVCAATDQRGATRPDACDIGAVEFGGLLPRVFVPLI